jgi:hypothetical protein
MIRKLAKCYINNVWNEMEKRKGKMLGENKTKNK